MIIITESKEKHYLIKEFINDVLKESTEDPYNNIWPVIPDREQADTVINTRVFKDDDVINAIKDEKVLNKIIKKQPKISGIKNLAKKGLITLGIAATLWSFAKNNIDLSNKDNSAVVNLYKAVEEQAKTQGVNISKDEIEKSFNTDNNNEISTSNIDNIESPQSNEIQSKEKKKASKNKTSREEIKKLVSERIKEFESYRPYPYQDAEGISIGYGTQFINKGKVKSLQDDWKDIIYKKIGLSEKEIKEKKKNEKYKESVDKELDQYIAEIDERIEELENKKDKVVNPYKNKKPKNWKPRYHFKKEFRNKLQKLINNLEKRKEVVKERGVLKKDEAENIFKIDLENRFDILESNFKNPYIMDAEIITVLLDMYYNIGPALETKFPSFIKHIESYHKEMSKKLSDPKKIKNILKEANKEISPKGAPVYHKQNPHRAKLNQELIQITINKYKTNESLKSVYKHLFV